MTRGSNSDANLDNDVELLLLQKQQNCSLFLKRPIDLNMNRSGSAPPTVEGAFRAAENLFRSANVGFSTEEEIRSHPDYVEYYYSNENLNPRLPPPLLSREDWRVAQRVRAAGQNKNLNDNSGSSSLFLTQPGLSVKKGEDELVELRKAAFRNVSQRSSSEMINRGSTGLVGASSPEMGVRRKSFADILQEGLGQPVMSHLSRPPSRNTVDVLCATGVSNTNADEVQNEAELYGIHSTASGVPNVPSSGIFEVADIADSLSGLNISKGRLHAEDISKSSLQARISADYYPNQQQHYFEKNNISYAYLTKNDGSTRGLNISNSLTNERTSFPRTSATTDLQSHLNPFEFANLEDMRILSQGYNFPGVDVSSHGHNGYTFSQELDTTINDHLASGSFFTGSTGDGWTPNQAGIRSPAMDPNQFQYLHKRNVGSFWGNSSQGRHVGSLHGHGDWQTSEKAYLEALLLQQQQQYLQHSLHKPNIINHPYPCNPSVSSYQGNLVNSLHSQSGNNTKGRFELLLEMAKNSKTKSLELSDILSHVLEFSRDQYGSRFIQQKLETATLEEKMMIYTEIMPHARSLMTDAFGNYVIQKFFDHGTGGQRKGLARNLIGHVLPLSLQMYGCRIVQKALEVVDVELQTQIVAELDGSVIKCVRDQNGNHVVQKCIECVPQDRIQFLISSFFGQVATLSRHPYGCRVIQRVLEHCNDPKTQQIIVDEIMSSVHNLAQDQYGNYVLQHILQHGKPHERSMIIGKLVGQIVKMSQQKYSSNVIEKCLIFGGPDEQKLLVNEMIGSTDENRPLQAMMRDPYGNYVVQKVLETCDDDSRDMILSRMKIHLTALKRCTYGRHFVSRIEKLVAAGEEQRAISSASSSRNDPVLSEGLGICTHEGGGPRT